MKNEHESVIAGLHQAMNEVKPRRELIPVCANCKRVRDDEGFWKVDDDIFHRIAGLDLTHSICPNCSEELYPDTMRRLREKMTGR